MSDQPVLPAYTAHNDPILYLTFDDGPDPTYTPLILECLASHQAQASFFVIGQRAQQYPDIVKAEAAAGHHVANHTFSHRQLTNIDSDLFETEVERTQRLLENLTGNLSCPQGHYLRPPDGVSDTMTRQYALELGYQIILWDVDPQDWREPGIAHIVATAQAFAEPGSVVLLHDGGGNRLQTVTALDAILKQFGALDYRFKTLCTQN